MKPPPTKLVDDLVVEILSRVPAKSLMRFKCVSKEWLASTSDIYNRKKLPATVSGLFYAGSTWNIDAGWRSDAKYLSLSAEPTVDTTLSFLPRLQNLHILDCCNGLLLCKSWDAAEPEDCCYNVCNPAMQKWITLPKPDESSDTFFLAFDPQVSHHFHVLHFDDSVRRTGIKLEIFSSKTGEWVHRQVHWEDTIGYMLSCPGVFFDGLVHMLSTEDYVLGFDSKGNIRSKIRLPESESDSGNKWLGHSGGYLNFAFQWENTIELWVLEDYFNNEWVLKHSMDVETIPRKERSKEVEFYLQDSDYFDIVAFHPDLDVIFLQVGDEILAYHLNSARREELASLRCEWLPNFYTYSPCFLDVFGDDGI